MMGEGCDNGKIFYRWWNVSGMFMIFLFDSNATCYENGLWYSDGCFTVWKRIETWIK